jgi:isoleucyl-tRNA synthetase
MTYGANTYFRMRHGGADHVLRGYVAGWPEKKNLISHLTKEGKAQVGRSARQLKKHKIDLIVSSPLTRMRESVAILKRHLKTARIIYDHRLREYDVGVFDYKATQNFHRFFRSPLEKFSKKPKKGETLTQATDRYLAVINDLERKYRGKNILLLGHGDPLWALEGRLRGLREEEIIASPYPKLGRWEKLPVLHLPKNETGEVDLHRPYIDEVMLSCPKCQAKMQRVREVIDVWFDSGAMPFAQWHWPFENKERIAKGLNFPGDYIAEGIDQTRGWFYTLHAISTALGKGPAYFNVISNGHVLDEKGEKMSKSKGNIVNPWEMIAKYGADSLRWYLCTVNPPGEPKKFAERDLAKTHQHLLILLNVLNFWNMYRPQSLDRAKPSRVTFLDRWLLARLSETALETTVALDAYDIRRAALSVQALIDDLSRWYLRRSRRRFQRPWSAKDLASASRILGEALRTLAKLMAPFTPFLAEAIWQDVRRGFGSAHEAHESVHLADWPKGAVGTKEKRLLETMQRGRDLAALLLRLRAASSLKVRQPLGRAFVRSQTAAKLGNDVVTLVRDEANVKTISFVAKLPGGKQYVADQLGEYAACLDTEITEALRREGVLRELIRQVQEGRQELHLAPSDTIALLVEAPKDLFAFLKKSRTRIQQEGNARRVTFGNASRARVKKSFEVGAALVRLGIKR